MAKALSDGKRAVKILMVAHWTTVRAILVSAFWKSNANLHVVLNGNLAPGVNVQLVVALMDSRHGWSNVWILLVGN